MYIPKRGEIIYLDLDPVLGHEQGGRRPAVVISEDDYNKTVGLCVILPITTKIKNFPFEVVLSAGQKIKGVVLTDQVRNISWRLRKVTFVEKMEEKIFEDCIQKMVTLLGVKI